jgi:hypothetical protein
LQSKETFVTSKAWIAGLMAIALLALPPLAAADQPQPGSAVAQQGPRDYSKNSASGEYTDPAEAALAKRGEALNRALARARLHAGYGAEARVASEAAGAPGPTVQAGFAWGDAAVGAGVVLALLALLGSFAVVRRRIGPGGPTPART